MKGLGSVGARAIMAGVGPGRGDHAETREGAGEAQFAAAAWADRLNDHFSRLYGLNSACRRLASDIEGDDQARDGLSAVLDCIDAQIDRLANHIDAWPASPPNE